MIYKLAEGDITKKKVIENECDIIDYYEWMNIKKYDTYLESEFIKRQNGKGKSGSINNFKGF